MHCRVILPKLNIQLFLIRYYAYLYSSVYWYAHRRTSILQSYVFTLYVLISFVCVCLMVSFIYMYLMRSHVYMYLMIPFTHTYLMVSYMHLMVLFVYTNLIVSFVYMYLIDIFFPHISKCIISLRVSKGIICPQIYVCI